MKFNEVKRETLEDVFIEDPSNNYDHLIFKRVNGIKKAFKNASFKYVIFEHSYFKYCTFIGCDFTGCKFINSNFHGSTFQECKFAYTSFEKTQIDNHVLDSVAPEYENLLLLFARTMRVNYQGLGDTKSANKAIKVELFATAIHLKKAWKSKTPYYREKYSGWKRLQSFTEWLAFKVLDFVWGNGEDIGRLLRFALIVVLAITIIDVSIIGKSLFLPDYINSYFKRSFPVFIGVEKYNFPSWLISVITLIRLTMFSLFISILVKKISRR